MSGNYNFHFSCDHTQSNGAILVSKKSIRHFPAPYARCEPHTPLGQALIQEMILSGYVPHLTTNGDIVMGAPPTESVGALKVVLKYTRSEQRAAKIDREVDKNWDNRRRGSQQCLVY